MIDLPPKEWFEKQTFWQLSLGFCGSTFVDWSINYLLDIQEHTAFFSDIGCGPAIIPQNPILNTGSAHGHLKNHPYTIGDIIWQAQCVYSNNPDEFNTFFHTLPLWFLTPDNAKYEDAVTNSIVSFFQKNSTIPHLVINPEPWAPALLLWRFLQVEYNNKNFNNLTLSEIKFPFTTDLAQPEYVVREQLALSNAAWHNRFRKRCAMQNRVADNLSSSLTVSISDIFENLDSVLVELSKKYKTLNFNFTKFDAWKEIYSQWQTSNPDIEWFRNLPILVNGIINKEDQQSTIKTPLEEMFVETELILANWSIKNYNLNRFPTDLRSLELEPLIHTIPSL